MAKDIDSVRVALTNNFRNVPVTIQSALLAEWLKFAFDWRVSPQGEEFWGEVHKEFTALSKMERYNYTLD